MAGTIEIDERFKENPFYRKGVAEIKALKERPIPKGQTTLEQLASISPAADPTAQLLRAKLEEGRKWSSSQQDTPKNDEV